MEGEERPQSDFHGKEREAPPEIAGVLDAGPAMLENAPALTEDEKGPEGEQDGRSEHPSLSGGPERIFDSRDYWGGGERGAERLEDDLGPDARRAYGGLGSGIRGMLEGMWREARGAVPDRWLAHMELWDRVRELRGIEAKIEQTRTFLKEIPTEEKFEEQLSAFRGLVEKHGIPVPENLYGSHAREREYAALRRKEAELRIANLAGEKQAFEARREEAIGRITRDWTEKIGNNRAVLEAEETGRAGIAAQILENRAAYNELSQSMRTWREKIQAGPDPNLGLFRDVPDLLDRQLRELEEEFSSLDRRRTIHDQKIASLRRDNDFLQQKVFRVRGVWSRPGGADAGPGREKRDRIEERRANAGAPPAAAEAAGAPRTEQTERTERVPAPETLDDVRQFGEFARRWNVLSPFKVSSRNQGRDFLIATDRKGALSAIQSYLLETYGGRRREDIGREITRLSKKL